MTMTSEHWLRKKEEKRAGAWELCYQVATPPLRRYENVFCDRGEGREGGG